VDGRGIRWTIKLHVPDYMHYNTRDAGKYGSREEPSRNVSMCKDMQSYCLTVVRCEVKTRRYTVILRYPAILVQQHQCRSVLQPDRGSDDAGCNV